MLHGNGAGRTDQREDFSTLFPLKAGSGEQTRRVYSLPFNTYVLPQTLTTIINRVQVPIFR